MAERTKGPDIEQRVYLERIRIFFAHANGAQIRLGVAALFVALSLYYGGVPLPWIATWLAVYTAATLGLTAVELRYRRIAGSRGNIAALAKIRVSFGAVCGLLLGGAAFLLPSQGNVVAELLITVVIVTGVAVTCIGYTTMPIYYFGLSFSSMIPLSLSFLRVLDQLHYTLFLMVVISQFVLLKKSLTVSNAAIDAIRVNERLKLEVEKRQRAEADANRALDAALRASSAKSDFLAHMSHELRTPMNAVIGFSGALEAGVAGRLNEKQLEYVEDIRNSGEHLLSLINQLLDLSKIEAGKFEVKAEKVVFSALVDQCIRLVRHHAKTGGVTLKKDIAADLPVIRADARLLGQLVVNLLSNAVKFSPEGGRVVIGARDMGNGSIELSVADQGPGISADDLPRIMLPFEQTELGKAMEGTGLGLPMVNRIVELHGGDFRLDSSPGQGTVAIVSLPIEFSEAVPETSDDLPADRPIAVFAGQIGSSRAS